MTENSLKPLGSKQHRGIYLSAALLLSLALNSQADNWAQWRGPHFNGSSDETGLPNSWEDGKNVRWKVATPGWSSSTPIVWGDHVFIVSPDARKSLLLVSYDAKTGKENWSKRLTVGDREVRNNNMTSPSPVTDGKLVYTLLGTGDLVAVNFAGEIEWRRNLGQEYGKFSLMWLYGSSPLFYNGKLYVQVLQRNPSSYPHSNDGKEERDSYLLCVDPANGKTLWKHNRPTDAIVESQEAYSTPIPFEGAGRKEILILGGDYVTGHNPETGEELWRCGGLNTRKDKWWRIVPSPVASDTHIYAAAPKRDPLFAIKAGGNGNITDTHVDWAFDDNPTDVATPLVYQGKLYVLDGDRQTLSCLDPETGEKHWAGHLGIREIHRASPTGADGKIYLISMEGTVTVVDAGKEFKILEQFKMNEGPCMSTIVAANGALFIRTSESLYCIGK